MKFCKDCRHVAVPDTLRELKTITIDRPEWFGMVAECHHPTAFQHEPPDPVTGITTSRWAVARWHRQSGYGDDNKNCGPHAQWFEPKEPPEPVGFADDDPSPRTGGAMETTEERLDKLEGE
jgi:hypothetical protein